MALTDTIAAAQTANIARFGTLWTLPDGTKRRAVIRQTPRFLRELRDEGNAPEKPPIELAFDGSAWGVVAENMTLTMGDAKAGTLRAYKVAAPLHPEMLGDVCLCLVVIANPH